MILQSIHRKTKVIIYGTGLNAMANQTDDYHGNAYQWNNTLSAKEGNAETEYYLSSWTDLILAGLFTILIIVTIVSSYVTLYLDFLHSRIKDSTSSIARARARVF